MQIGFYGGKFLTPHLGHLRSIITASTYVDKLYVIVFYGEIEDKKAFENSRISYLSESIRIRMLREMTLDMENVEVIGIEASYENNDYLWENDANKVREIIPNIDYVFSAEKEYELIFTRLYNNSKIITLVKDLPISSSKIRKDGALKWWEFIPNKIRYYYVKKVVVLGIESCGKSTLIRNLAKYYNTEFVNEVGRDVCEAVGGAFSLIEEDYQEIAYRHKVVEIDKQKLANKVLFIDTEAIVTSFYAKLYNSVQNVSLYAEINKLNKYDLVLYLEPDVDWVNDGTRYNKESRKEDNKTLKKILLQNNIQYTSIKGNYNKRFSDAKIMVDELLY